MTPESFIARWQHADGSELANAQSFVRELCELLDVPVPDPAHGAAAPQPGIESSFPRRRESSAYLQSGFEPKPD